MESFAHGVCFSREPLAPGQLFLVETRRKSWAGAGTCASAHRVDPASLAAVPEFSLPDLVSLGHTCLLAITRAIITACPEGRLSGRGP